MVQQSKLQSTGAEEQETTSGVDEQVLNGKPEAAEEKQEERQIDDGEEIPEAVAAEQPKEQADDEAKPLQDEPVTEHLQLYSPGESLLASQTAASKLLSSGSVTDEYLFKTEVYSGLRTKRAPVLVTEIHAAVLDFGRHSIKFGNNFSPFVEPYVMGMARNLQSDSPPVYGSKAARGGAIYSLEWPCQQPDDYLEYLLLQNVVENNHLVFMADQHVNKQTAICRLLESGHFQSVAVVNQLEMSLLNSGFVTASVVNAGAYFQTGFVYEGRLLPYSVNHDMNFGGIPFQAQLQQMLGVRVSQITADKIAADFTEGMKRQESDGQEIKIELPDGTVLSQQQLETVYDTTKAAKEAAVELLCKTVEAIQEEELHNIAQANTWITGGFQPVGGPGQLQNYLGALLLAETAEFYVPRSVTRAELQEYGPELVDRFYFE